MKNILYFYNVVLLIISPVAGQIEENSERVMEKAMEVQI